MKASDFSINRDAKRFELRTGNHVSFIKYQEKDGVYDLVHTKVPEELSGQGVGKQLVTQTLDYLRNNGQKAIGTCSFVARFFERNPSYADVRAAQ